ncbi:MULTISPECIES: hypothetical protein [Bradyrhizobium]|uniref:Uncharacterized protein n=1 Tax=Bradyrhizobium barranii subsp. barranii TaxID=2823807 RepID=A0A939RY00_9BRAD|nr:MULTISPECIES: hypothetical protein [Bradyrhizobium]MCP1747532.1 hypothetical protein [Bradyrhizobium japonicum]MCP1865192.1 hypothetical protein [Bradyrhizobium japonicum]MCP1896035.1 hypothetical protein [Bradyrhizobium japonicum]MCW2329421.1 hypothetical protein [Bradyrhizobium japonicum]UEM12425.1 hypothetical protein J4G43_049935 [Bradyrhizobium barranii subsp. barranii]
MPIERLTYVALAARLKVSPGAARSLAKRRQLPRSLSDDGNALVCVDLAEMRHKPRRTGGRQPNNALRAESILGLQAEIARLEATAAGHRADFERERERADRLMAEVLRATAEASAAKKMTARLEGSLRTAVQAGGSIDGHGRAGSRLGHLAADLVKADRNAWR